MQNPFKKNLHTDFIRISSFIIIVNIIHQARLQRLGIQAERFQSPLKDLFAIPGISLIFHIYSGEILFY